MNYSLVFCLQATRGQTTLIIAHWLSTAQTVALTEDTVHGTVVEMGMYTELIGEKEPYYSLVASQVCWFSLLLLFA